MQKYEDSWITRKGEIIKISDLNANHLNNIIAMLRRKVVEFKEEYLRFDNRLPQNIKDVIGEELEHCLIEERDFNRDLVASRIYPNWNSLVVEQKKRIASTAQADLDKKEGKMSGPEKVYKVGFQRQPGWLYYFDNGNIMRTRMVRGGQKKNPDEKPQVVLRTDVIREDGYLYYIDKEGDVCRTPAGKKMSKGKSLMADGWYHSPSYNPHLFYYVESNQVKAFYNLGAAPGSHRSYPWPILPKDLSGVTVNGAPIKEKKQTFTCADGFQSKLWVGVVVSIDTLRGNGFSLYQQKNVVDSNAPGILKPRKKKAKPKLVEVATIAEEQDVKEIQKEAVSKVKEFNPTFATVATLCLGTAGVLSAWKAKKALSVQAEQKKEVVQEVAA